MSAHSWSVELSKTHTQTHTHRHTDTHRHTQTHTDTHRNTNTHTHHTHIQKHTHANHSALTHTCMYAHTRVYTHTHSIHTHTHRASQMMQFTESRYAVWTASKSESLCPCQTSSQWLCTENTGRGSPLNHPSCSCDDLISQRTDLNTESAVAHDAGAWRSTQTVPRLLIDSIGGELWSRVDCSVGLTDRTVLFVNCHHMPTNCCR